MRFCLALFTALTPAVGFAQVMDAGTSTNADGGMPDAGGCGTVTFEGECQGNTVVYCDTDVDELVSIDCLAEYGPTSICQTIDAEFGVWCALATGEQCIYEDSGEFLTDFCQGAGAGCVETPEDGTCQANLGACTEVDINTCRGNRLVYDCNVNQPWLVDCAAFLGTCDEDHCVVPGGILCDDEVLVCEEGTVCGPLGICEMATMDAGVPDSGSAPLDAGIGGEEEDKGCGCTTRGESGRMPYLLLLVAAWFILRRRDR